MTEAWLASGVLAKGLLRLADSQGGSGVVLARGDETAGAVTVILAEKGVKLRILERALGAGGNYSWQAIPSQAAANEEDFNKFLERRRKFDPDMWIIELDIASAERFAAEMNALS